MTILNVNDKAFIRLEIIRLVGRITDKVTRDGEPLDGDETEDIANYFLLELDYVMGNITTEEWEDGRSKTKIYSNRR